MVSTNAPPNVGGIETHLHEVAPRIVSCGFDVTILTTDRSGKLPQRENYNGVQVVRVPAWPRERDYYLAPDVYRVIRGQRWDLLHCHGYQTLLPPLALLAARRAGIPYVVTLHSGGDQSRVRARLRGINYLAMRPLLSHAKRLIAVSDWERAQFARHLRLSTRRFVTIPNGAALSIPSAPLGVKEDPNLILSVGRLERYKGHHRVIAALPELLHQLPQARLRIAGSGPYEDALRRQVARLGIEDRVEIAPVDPRDRAGMASLLSRAALVVLLSEYESQGIAAMEALAMGKRLLVSDTTALGEIARQGYARGISLDSSPADTARAMLERLDAPSPDPLQLPTWNACADAVAAIYREVLGSRV